MSLTKRWAVPKLLIPLGFDSEGRSVSCTCWGKGIPRESLYDDDFAKTWDLEMMYKVQKLVRVLHAEGSALLPGDAPVNRDVLAPTSKL